MGLVTLPNRQANNVIAISEAETSPTGAHVGLEPGGVSPVGGTPAGKGGGGGYNSESGIFPLRSWRGQLHSSGSWADGSQGAAATRLLRGANPCRRRKTGVQTTSTSATPAASSPGVQCRVRQALATAANVVLQRCHSAGATIRPVDTRDTVTLRGP